MDKQRESFIEKLKKLVKVEVKDGMSQDKIIEEEIERAWAERLKVSPIMDVKEEKRFKQNMRKTLEAAINEKDENEEIEEKKEKAKVEKNTKLKNPKDKKIGYLDRLELVHQVEMRMLREQQYNGEFVPERREAYKLMLLKKSLEQDRENYVETLDEKGKEALLKLEEKYRNQELDVVRKQNKEYRENLDELNRLNKKSRDLNDKIEYAQKEMREGKIDPEEYKKQMKQYEAEFNDVQKDISRLNPQKLQEIADEKERQSKLERGIMGRKYRENVYLRSSGEMKERLDYLNGNNKLQAAVILAENKVLKAEGIDRLLEEQEHHKKELEKELDKLEKTPENIERRAEVLKELRITDTKIDGYTESKEDMEIGMQKDIDVEAKIDEQEEKIEEQVKEVEKEFESIDEVIEKKEKDEANIGKAEEEKETEKEISEQAFKTGVKTAVVVDIANGPGGHGDAMAIGAVAGAVKGSSLRDEWQNAVSKEYNEDDVKAKVERDAALQEALDEQEQEYTIERTRKN